MKNGVARADRRDRKARRRMPVHGRSLEAVMNAVRKRAARVKTSSTEKKRPGQPPRSSRSGTDAEAARR